MTREKGTKLTDAQIKIIENAGCNRWTKYGKDRLYVNEEFIGLQIECYNTGRIRYAELNGEKISNNYAYKLSEQLNGTYINVDDSRIYANDLTMPLIAEAIDALPEC